MVHKQEAVAIAGRPYASGVMPNSKRQAVPLLLLVVLLIDLLTPLLIWKGIIPGETRLISRAAIAAMIPLLYMKMILVTGIPRPVFFALAVSLTAAVIALLNGQGLLATAWGGWILLQFPLAGLYSYLWPYWPDRFADRLCSFSIAVLVFQVLVQIGQYLAGEVPGDNLAGLFGYHGTGDLVLFLLFLYCLCLGRWLDCGRWQTALLVLLLGGVASSLGEMKLFPLAATVLSFVAIAIYAAKKGSFAKIMPFAVASSLAVLASVVVYERVVNKSLTDYLDPNERDAYMFAFYEGEDGTMAMGRGYALAHGWETIRQDFSALVFGFGLGARGESRSLGTTGAGLEQETALMDTGTGLLVLLHEMGTLGLAFLGVSLVWIVGTLIRDIRKDPKSNARQLRYGLLLFSLLWPLWFWYGHVLTFRVPMIYYWVSLGYVLAEAGRTIPRPRRMLAKPSTSSSLRRRQFYGGQQHA